MDEQIDRLVNITKSPKVDFANNNDDSEPEESGEDNPIKDVANDFIVVEKTGPPIGKYLASIINNVIFYPVGRKNLIQKLEKHLDLKI